MLACDFDRGKLPITMYPHEYIKQQPLTNYDMSVAPGRTYRYYQNKPLFAFGMGLSLTQFSLKCSNTMVQAAKPADGAILSTSGLSSAHTVAPVIPAIAATSKNISVNVVCTVANTGTRPTRTCQPSHV